VLVVQARKLFLVVKAHLVVIQFFQILSIQYLQLEAAVAAAGALRRTHHS
tara:strand:- start:219 stop:368 length:150 start_codon:yes stop_codon:yes gene_type:complete